MSKTTTSDVACSERVCPNLGKALGRVWEPAGPPCMHPGDMANPGREKKRHATPARQKAVRQVARSPFIGIRELDPSAGGSSQTALFYLFTSCLFTHKQRQPSSFSAFFCPLLSGYHTASVTLASGTHGQARISSSPSHPLPPGYRSCMRIKSSATAGVDPRVSAGGVHAE